MSDLSFNELREINVLRCEQSFFPLDAWNGSDWGNAIAGETGEACNVIKKLRRAEINPELKAEVTVNDLAKELADIVLYADLTAAAYGIDLGLAVAKKFNEVSDRVKSPLKLPAPPTKLLVHFCHDLEDGWYEVCTEEGVMVLARNHFFQIEDELAGKGYVFEWAPGQVERYKPSTL